MDLKCKCLKCGAISIVKDDSYGAPERSIFLNGTTLTCPGCGNRNFPKILCPDCHKITKPSLWSYNSVIYKCGRFFCKYQNSLSNLEIVLPQ